MQENNSLYYPKFCNKWDAYKLYDLAKWKNGLAFKNINFSDFGYPVIKIAELKNGLTTQTRYTKDKFDDTVRLIKGDIVFSWSGNPETSIDVFWYNLPTGWLNQHIFKITVKEIVEDKYFYYLLKSLKPTFKQIATNKQTTGLGHITIADLKRIQVKLPEPCNQRHVSSILSVLDDYIKVNQKINNKLEEIAQSLFKHWFIDFNFPDENGTPYKDSGGAMVDSELGKIPKGWGIVELGNIITLNKGKSYKSSELANFGLPMVNLKCFGRNHEFRHDGIKYFIGQYKDTHIVKSNDLVISMTDVTQQAEIIANVLMIPNYLSKAIISLDVSSINSKNGEVSNYFLYYLLKTKMFRDFAKGYASGTTVLHLNKNGILNYKFVLPDSTTLKQISAILKDIITQKDTNIAQNVTLTNIRDTLLPKLMSGEIDVSKCHSRVGSCHSRVGSCHSRVGSCHSRVGGNPE